jgi:hypothetical protein
MAVTRMAVFMRRAVPGAERQVLPEEPRQPLGEGQGIKAESLIYRIRDQIAKRR